MKRDSKPNLQNENGEPSHRISGTDSRSGEVLKRESSLVDEQYARYMESGETTTSTGDTEMSGDASDHGIRRVRVSSLPTILEERKKGNSWTRM